MTDEQNIAAAASVGKAQADVTSVIGSPSLGGAEQVVADVGDVVSQPAFTGLVHEAPQIVEETRRGWKTTEFWGVIAAAVASVGPIDLSNKEKIIVSGLAVFYAIARGLAKAGSPNVTPA
jgi:hypothetical protein